MENQTIKPHESILLKRLGVYNTVDRIGNIRRSPQSFRSPKWLGFPMMAIRLLV